MAYLFLIFAFTFNAVASLLLKFGADNGVSLSLKDGILSLISKNGFLLSGLFLFALNILFYIAALRVIPLSVAYPIMVGMSFIIVALGSTFFLHEPFSFLKIIGYLLVLSGVLLIVTIGGE